MTRSSPSASIFCWRVGDARTSAGVALLTPTSVACADSTTATKQRERVDEFEFGPRDRPAVREPPVELRGLAFRERAFRGCAHRASVEAGSGPDNVAREGMLLPARATALHRTGARPIFR